MEWQKEQRIKREREEKKAKAHEKAERDGDVTAATPARWQSWGTQVESNRIVGMYVGGGARFYANYHLDEEGGMSCLLLSPRGASVIKAATAATLLHHRAVPPLDPRASSRGQVAVPDAVKTVRQLRPLRKICGG